MDPNVIARQSFECIYLRAKLTILIPCIKLHENGGSTSYFHSFASSFFGSTTFELWWNYYYELIQRVIEMISPNTDCLVKKVMTLRN